ncbi:MAG: ribonuclease HII [Proteobacteria bacterium]|nr:ribonuclease HII [Pseudomonadota bacterium]
MGVFPDFQIEAKLASAGIVGIDEVGRGALAGPVIAAAIILPYEAKDIWLSYGITDSKKLTARKREELYDILIAQCQYATGMASSEEVDEYNVLQATMMAMRRAAEKMPAFELSWRLIDGNRSPWPQDKRALTVIGGDSKSITIAAASIIAKVTRDKLMQDQACTHPHYMWEENKGYGTTKHLAAIREFGPSPLHRQTFLKRLLA